MKATLLLLVPASLLVSCNQNQGQDTTPVAPAANTGNQYGVPAAGAPGAYAPANPPYQPVGPINPPAAPAPVANPYATPAPVAVTPSVPATPAPAPDLNGNVYTIQKGDSLWGISRKYGTSVSAIKEANGMTDDTIIDGRTLIIPGR
ncbi:LysM peptidoglycan-binding domain-containing protein [bacterium]|nr:LysM peptidoglycan-binding domain-containing protein [bacterium]